MLFGEKQSFAIECEVRDQTPDGWVFGCFLFWIAGARVGNPADATDLKGCRNWLREFLDNPRQRYDEALRGKSPEQVFELVHTATMAGAKGESVVKDAYARFNIGHLGMSSFDRFDLVLVEEPDGGQRLLWREGDGKVQFERIKEHGVQSVVRECLEWMSSAF